MIRRGPELTAVYADHQRMSSDSSCMQTTVQLITYIANVQCVAVYISYTATATTTTTTTTIFWPLLCWAIL